MTVLCSEYAMRCLLRETFETAVMNFTRDDCSISIIANVEAIPDYYSMPLEERLDLLQIGRDARDKARRVRLAGEILLAASGGASAIQIARQIHVKPKYIHRKLDSLTSIGLLDKKQGIYFSAQNEGYTTPRRIHNKAQQRKEGNC